MTATLPIAGKKISVLVVDDSAVARMHLVHLLEADPDIRVIGTVNDGEAAIEFLKEHRPSVVLMDITMPGLGGFETTRRIMERRPIPIVICSGTENPKNVAASLRALEAGAVACVEKPVGYEREEFEQAAAELRQTVKRMAGVEIASHWARARPSPFPPKHSPKTMARPLSRGLKVIGVGASTGGPVALQRILGGLPKTFAVPLLVVQHIGPGFIGGLASWLNDTTSLQICIASHGTQALAGRVYFSPDDFHMGLGADGLIELSKTNPENGSRPAISYLFRSLARECGPAAVGVMLTGMGDDGALELKGMRDEGAVTIAQDRATSVVYGMPGVAIGLGGATHVLAVGEIAAKLIFLAGEASANWTVQHA